jgi:hypothetical protein
VHAGKCNGGDGDDSQDAAPGRGRLRNAGLGVSPKGHRDQQLTKAWPPPAIHCGLTFSTHTEWTSDILVDEGLTLKPQQVDLWV